MHASPRRRKHFSMDSQLSNLRRHCFRLGDGNRGVRVAMQEEEVRRAAAHVIDRQCIAPDIRLLGLSRAQIADDNLRCRLALGQRWHIQHRVECHNALTRVGCFGLPSLPSYFGSSRAPDNHDAYEPERNSDDDSRPVGSQPNRGHARTCNFRHIPDWFYRVGGGGLRAAMSAAGKRLINGASCARRKSRKPSVPPAPQS
jgi:hypothetical protein